MKETTIIRIRRGIGNTRYCACDNNGGLIMGFNRLSDIRKHWRREIQWGHVVLVRELDQVPDLETINHTISCLEKILKAYAGEGGKDHAKNDLYTS